VLGAFGALVAIQGAIITRSTGCEYGCHRTPLYDIQLAVACVGAVPVGFMVWALFTERRRLALVLLVVSLATYAAWGFLNDAAVHPKHPRPGGIVTMP
jgi:hypothetical protein